MGHAEGHAVVGVLRGEQMKEGERECWGTHSTVFVSF